MRSLPTFAVLAILVGCAKGRPVEKIDPDEIRISPEVVIRHDQVGEGKFETRASYVLVDVENLADTDALITLAGTLVDAAGEPVGTLRPESLFIPEGGRRMFALIDDRNAERAAAVDARIELRGAVVPRWRPSVRVHDVEVFDDRGRVMIAGHVTNQADRPGKIIVFAGFQDAEGKPMARPFLLLELGSQITDTVRFVGPEGSKAAYLFLGDGSF